MANVASNINLPIKLLWPNNSDIPNSSCSMIGLGDIVIPALLLSFCDKIDK